MNTHPQRSQNRSIFFAASALTALFELITCAARFGLRLETTRDTASSIGHFTCGLRIHHSYIGGLFILIACLVWDRFPQAAFWLLVIGLGLFFSDLIHHFVVLWWFVGDPQFELVYPAHLMTGR